MRAVFLDRDGVVVKDKGYHYMISDLELMEGAAGAIAKLNKMGYLAIIVSNQSGIARGYFSEKALLQFNEHLLKELDALGAKVDGIYYCPHHPTEAKVKKYLIDCECRKPKPGMLLEAANDHNIDLSKSWMVGDKETDVKAGLAAGCKTIYIGAEKNKLADGNAANITEAVDIILSTP